MKELNEKVAIITGAGQGIGKGIALHLGKRGVKVVCVGRRLDPIVQTVKEVEEAGGQGFAITCDVGNREDVKKVVKATVEKYGTVDVVVNNAQSLPGSAKVEDTTYEQMLTAWQSGTIGSLNMMQECFPYMKDQNEGRIINFASATGMFGYAGQLAYGCNKESIRGLTKIAAKEWAQYNIIVNCVLPGAESPVNEIVYMFFVLTMPVIFFIISVDPEELIIKARSSSFKLLANNLFSSLSSGTKHILLKY